MVFCVVKTTYILLFRMETPVFVCSLHYLIECRKRPGGYHSSDPQRGVSGISQLQIDKEICSWNVLCCSGLVVRKVGIVRGSFSIV